MSVGSAEQQTTNKHTGCVKWFNNKCGYGFITLMDDDAEFKGRDIFSHHSSIRAGGDLYKYLVQGEYVEFGVQKMDSKNEHEHQAVNITGIMSGELMCETRFKNKDLSRVHDGFAPPRHVRATDHIGELGDRGERPGGDRTGGVRTYRSRPQNRPREERSAEN
jgi:cold shock CspA family protein|tara:strand:- start:1805 stop:2293 length:489 start_codon:yes stop_codon:yes gene_type:complete